MKKIFPLLLFAVIISSSASAQIFRYGVVGAANFSSYSMDAAGFDVNTDSRVGFKAGFRVEMDAPFLLRGLYFDAEATISSKGAEYTGVNGDAYANVSSRPYYLEIPMHIGYHYTFSDSEFGIFGSFGPYFGIGLFGTEKYFTGGVKSKPDTFSKSNLQRFDFGLGLRAGVSMFDHYRIFIGYDWGLVNISNVNGLDINNRNFYIGASYMF